MSTHQDFNVYRQRDTATTAGHIGDLANPGGNREEAAVLQATVGARRAEVSDR